MKTLEIATKARMQMLDITHLVRRAVLESGIREGQVVLFVPHTTAAVTINENADPDVVSDMMMELDRMVPLDDGYRHDEGNSAAHIKSTLVGASQTVLIEGAELMLGTWQGIYFCEFDGPRKRNLWLRVSGA